MIVDFPSVKVGHRQALIPQNPSTQPCWGFVFVGTLLLVCTDGGRLALVLVCAHEPAATDFRIRGHPDPRLGGDCRPVAGGRRVAAQKRQPCPSLDGPKLDGPDAGDGAFVIFHPRPAHLGALEPHSYPVAGDAVLAGTRLCGDPAT